MATAAKTTDLRILHVEDDPALRRLLGDWMTAHDDVSAVEGVATAQEALDAVSAGRVDVALIDVALGPAQINGYELGLALRAKDRTLPIVMFSQYPPVQIDDVVPAPERHHWSYVRKSPKLDIDALLETIHMTMVGVVHFDDAADGAPDGTAILQRLSPRQREVMALAATGLDARAIAEHLHLAHVSVRRELSRSYRVLVPDAPAGTDLRTAAVLAYLRLAAVAGIITAL